MLSLCACDAGDAKNRQDTGQKPAQARQMAAQKNAYSEAELRTADAIIAYANKAGRYLETGFPAIADTFNKNVKNYLKTFRLPARKQAGARRPELLRPDSGLFDQEEAAQMTAALADMDKALDAILGHYANLEKYVADRSVRDDGALGSELAEKISASHERFVKARRSWLEIVEAKAARAEQILLAEHPLKRQIIAGASVLAQIRQARDLLASGSPKRDLLSACVQNIENGIAIGSRPPFPDKPGLERLYRAFLKCAQRYSQALAIVASEGAHTVQLQAAQTEAMDCIAAWNEFAQACNGG